MILAKRKKQAGIFSILVLALLVCLTLSSVFSGLNSDRADASVISSKVTLSGDLLLNGYKTRTDGNVFNGDVLQELYNKLVGKTGATFNDVISASKRAKSGTSSAQMHGGLDSKDIRDLNSGKNIVVSLGGKNWTVTSLTTDDSSTPNVVLTLWLAESSFTSKYNLWSDTNLSQSYPSIMYSSSYIRARLLNGVTSDGSAVKYVASAGASTLTTYSKDSTYPFGIYTTKPTSSSNRSNGGIADFIVLPQNIPYQKTESLYYSKANNWTALANEALNTLPSSIWENSNMYAIQSKSGYNSWGKDYIWLPSWIEMGWPTANINSNNFSGHVGLWNSDSQMRGSDNNAWLRSGTANGRDCTFVYDDGRGYWTSADSTGSIRPALHLNLTAAQNSSVTSLTNPTDVTTTYDGTQQEYFKSNGSNVSWYDSTLYSSANANVKVEYFYEDGTTPLPTSTMPIEYGTYKVKLTIQSSKYQWASGGTEKTITYKIDKRSLSVDFNSNVSPPTATPTNLCSRDTDLNDTILRIRYNTVGMTDYTYDYPTNIGNYVATVEIYDNDNYKLATTYTATIAIKTSGVAIPKISGGWLTYNGQSQSYLLQYDKDKITVEVAEGYAGKGLFEFVDDEYILVTNAGEYKDALKATLKDPYNPADSSGSDVWAGTTADTSTKYISFSLNTLNLEVTTLQSVINAQQGDSPVLSIMTPNKPNSSDNALNVKIMAQIGTSTQKQIGEFSLSSASSNAQSVELDLTTLLVTGDYTLTLEPDNTNYSLSFKTAVTLKLSQKSEKPTLIWWLQEGGNMTGSSANADIGAADKGVAFDEKITYNGKEFSFFVTANNGYEVDTSYNIGDFVAGYSHEKAVNAGSYTTQVAIKKEGETTEIYSIAWTIEKALFDLSPVVWKDNGKAQYTGREVEMVLENLPSGLVASYDNNKGSTVGKIGSAFVSFTLTGDAVGNYEIPQENGKGSNYVFDGSGDFAWEIDWEIIRAIIAIGNRNDWESASYTNDNGNTYDYYKLKDSKADGVVEYEYYECDSNGKILQDIAPIDLKDLEYSDTVKKYYRALPKITDENNYTFTDGVTDLYSPMFVVGGGAVEVQVSIATDKIEYNGKPRNVKLKVSSGATVNDFDLTYYSGDIADEAHKLEGAPTERGNYLVVITSNKTSVVLSGTTQYTFEIIAATIKKEWNKDAKPYVLNLKYGQIDGIEYKIADAQGNPVEYSQLSAGNTYQIKAIIKEDMRNNYSFTDGTYETDWEEFELRAEDIPNMQDPNDPNNTHYPQEDEDDDSNNNPGDNNTPSGNDPGSGNNGGGGSV
ncbi:MAG: hypothetical protein K2G42_04840, partial [Clostridia bacterium]|nr:hypothetical protein [Clostridia bacterium]